MPTRLWEQRHGCRDSDGIALFLGAKEVYGSEEATAPEAGARISDGVIDCAGLVEYHWSHKVCVYALSNTTARPHWADDSAAVLRKEFRLIWPRAGALVRGGWCSEARFHPNLMRHPVFSGSQGAVINIAGSFCVRLVGRVGPKMRIDPGPSNEGALIFRRGTGRKGCGCQLGGSGPRRDGWLLGDRF